MSRPKHPMYHLGKLGQFMSGAGADVDYVRLPCVVVSREAGIRTNCKDADDLWTILTAHWEATERRWSVSDVLEWATDQSPPMTVNEVTANLRRVSVDPDWLRY